MNGSASRGPLKKWNNSKLCVLSSLLKSFPGGTSGKEPTCLCRRCKRHRFDPWVRKIPWGGHGNLLRLNSGESYGQRRPAGPSPGGHKQLDTTELTKQQHSSVYMYYIFFIHSSVDGHLVASMSGLL